MNSNAVNYLGHRQRILNKLRTKGSDQFTDYEIIELMLFLIFKRRDTKLLAKQLLIEFKSLDKILTAPDNKLLQIDGIGQSTIDAFKIIRTIIIANSQTKIERKNIMHCYYDVIEFCRSSLTGLHTEVLKILSLNKNFEIIDISTLQTGTIDSVSIYPREILKYCITCSASAFIMVHNHPSGNPSPSSKDLEITKLIQRAAGILGITLFDHIIVSDNSSSSFRSMGLL